MISSDLVVKASFRQRLGRIKDDIAAGRITFYNSRPEVIEEYLETIALNCTLLVLASEAKWN